MSNKSRSSTSIAQGISLSLHHAPTHHALITQLVEYQYIRVPMVLDPGDFSVRGSIIDVYPINHAHPIRLDYFGEELDRLVSFSVHSQRTLSALEATTILPFTGPRESSFLSNYPDTQLLSDIQEDDYVVHEKFGIGQFKGLVRKTVNRKESEFLCIAYKGNDKLFVPLEAIHFVKPYQAGEAIPKVNGLYDGSWAAITQKVKKATVLLAEDLYLLYKERKTRRGFSFLEETEQSLIVEKSCPFTLTKDQKTALKAVYSAMESEQPMDMLLCGEVGFGKTEVLMRAACKACDSHKQVAILVPTTILAEQHFKVFKERLKNTAYTIGQLSRFSTKKDQKLTLEKLKNHKIDIVIGTQRLLSKDVVFHDLGLLVIDEEQRFGVDHKENLKKLKVNIDVLSVSATPIPRTLFMSLTGARELATITTPPLKRKPVITHVSKLTDDKVASAIEVELNRGGQVYYIYNKVRSIATRAAKLKKAFPASTVGIAHGQMDEKSLKHTMQSFSEGAIDILVCSTIIENGLDIPKANTIIIEHADHFGLSQIHQLRGRVGRSSVQGYAYLFYKDSALLTEKGIKRLQAIKEYAALGAGYKLAVRDLEIRGAGTLLGKQQHGNMVAVGFELYCQLLEGSVRQLKKEKISPKQYVPPIFIPDSYIENDRERLAIYKRLSNLEDPQELEDLKNELYDRFGDMPTLVEDGLTGLTTYLG